MKHIKQGPVIRQDEQLVVIVEQALVNEARYYGRKEPRIWRGVLEAERREFMTYRDVADFALENEGVKIIKALRIGMSDGSVEDITDDVLDAISPEQEERPIYNPAHEHSTWNHAQAGLMQVNGARL
jgi:hypothetical protein